MRTTIGLIIGLALGMLVMHFSTSTYRLSQLDESSRTRERTETETHPAESAGLQTHRQAVAQALYRQWQTLSVAGDVVVICQTHDDDPVADALTEAVSEVLSASADLMPRLASSPDELFAEPLRSRALFCADHDTLGDILAEARASSRSLPTIFTAGWSDRLETICATDPQGIAGSALLIPAGQLERLNQIAPAQKPLPQDPTPAAVQILTPAGLLRIMTTTPANETEYNHTPKKKTDHE